MVDSSRNCNEAALKIAFNLAPVEVDIIAGPSTNGCAPLTVNFTNLTQNGANFLWDYGDGSPTDTTFSPTHTFTAAGTFTVTLTAHNANACFVTDDTMTLVVTVAINQLNPDFTFVVTDSCGPYAATFTNTSTGTSAGTNYQWYFSDGTTFAGANPGAHTFPDSGSYTVTLVLTDTSACNSPDSITKTISIYGFRVGATFVIPDSLCLGLSFTPITDIKNATSTVWTYSDGFTSTSAAPAHTFTAVGTYSVTLVVTNPGSCNGADTFIQVIKIITAPIANFTFVPITAEPNIPTTFTNLSVNAVRYNWDFGDGTNSNIVNPVHQFSRTGTYHVCLTAYNSSNCPSVACREVPADVTPIIGLPTGFSPNGDGENDILYVRGAAIQTLDLKIYNRWGQMVFQTTDKAKGWDGTFNGQPCPVEAYGYVLTVSFIDASSKTLKGNITLLR
jgi:gliding motility-associated-like protein